MNFMTFALVSDSPGLCWNNNKPMKTINLAVSASLLCSGLITGMLGLPVTTLAAAPKKVLVVTTTTDFRHSSIPTAEKVIAQLGQQSGAFTVDYARVEPTDPEFKGDGGKPDPQKVNAAIQRVLADKMSPASLK